MPAFDFRKFRANSIPLQHSFHAFCKVQQGKIAHRLEAGLAGGERDEIFEVDAEIEFESIFSTLLLEFLERRQGIAPFGGDLGKCEVGTAQLGPEGVHTDENFCDLIIVQRSFQNINAVGILADAAQAGEALGILLISWVVEAADACPLEEWSIAIRLEYISDFYPVGKLLQLPGAYHEGHFVEPLL